MADKPKLIDGLLSFEGGLDQGVHPYLLEKNQLARSVNATVRGGFVTDRPPYYLRPVTYTGGIQAAVESGLFQGALYYKPDTGNESLCAAISGHLYQFVVSGNTITAADVSVAGDPNPADVRQAWLWQAENYLIWTDGQSVTTFFDGTSSRRSLGASQVLATIAAPGFTAPDVGDIVSIPLTASYTGPTGITVLIDGALYELSPGASGYPITIKNITDTPATVQPSGSQVQIQPGNLGVTAADFVVPAFGFQVTLENINDTAGAIVPAASALQSLNDVFGFNQSSHIVISSASPGYRKLLFDPLFVSWSGNQSVFYNGHPMQAVSGVYALPYVAIQSLESGVYSFAIPVGALLTTSASPAPGTTVGTTSAAFTAPAVGATVNVLLNSAYTGALNQIVTIGGKYYKITANTGTATVNVDLTVPFGGAVGNKLLISGNEYQVSGIVDADTITIFATTNSGAAGSTVVSGTAVTYSGSTPPNSTVGLTVGDFTAPAINATVDITIDTAFTGTLPQLVWINNVAYQITAIIPAPPNTVFGRNITDTSGDIIPAVTDILSLAELPPGRMGTYGMGRVAMSLVDGRSFIMGDLVGSDSGSSAFSFRDAVLKVTENEILAGGGSFAIPSSSGGTISAMRYVANLDTSLGQGPLQVFTQYETFSCNAPIDRTTWQDLTTPILTESIKSNGSLSHNATYSVNSDLIFRSLDGIRSLILARRDFATWGNVPISREVKTILDDDNKSLLQFASGVDFDNRSLMTCSPTQGNQGVYHTGLIALNLDPLSNIRGKLPSVYDGLWNGLNVLQILKGTFAGVERCFAFMLDAALSKIQLVEIEPTGSLHFDNGTNYISWLFESPMLFKDSQGKAPFDLLKLENGELYADDIIGRVDFAVSYKPDFDTTWYTWRTWTVCADNINNGEPAQYRNRMGLGTPNDNSCNPNTNQPSRFARAYQVKVEITGHCRFMAAKFIASIADQPEAPPIICESVTCNIVPGSA